MRICKLKILVAYSEHAVSELLEHEYLAMMPPKIRASIARYKRWQDRQATLFGKLLLLKALETKHPDAGMEKLRSMTVGQHGKPCIQGGPEFNISHSEGLVVLAVSEQGTLGIDLEKIRDINIKDFLRYVPEVADLHLHHTPEQVKDLFFDCWTQKEAVLKGSGKGLLAPLDQVVLQGNTSILYDTTWHLKKLLLDKRYCCHIATNQPLEHVTVEFVNLMDTDFICNTTYIKERSCHE